MVIGNAKILPDLRVLDRFGIDCDDDLRFVLHLQKHLEFGIRKEARQNTGSMEVIEELATEFKVELATEIGDSLFDFLALDADVLLVIEPDFVHTNTSNSNKRRCFLYG